MSELHILFDGPPSHESGRFVEAEDENGKSVSIGEWKEIDGYWYLVIPYNQAAERTIEQQAARIGGLNGQLVDAEQEDAAERLKLHYRIIELEALLPMFNPCGHTGLESASCNVCGYPDSRKLIAKQGALLKAVREEMLDCLANGRPTGSMDDLCDRINQQIGKAGGE